VDFQHSESGTDDASAIGSEPSFAATCSDRLNPNECVVSAVQFHMNPRRRINESCTSTAPNLLETPRSNFTSAPLLRLASAHQRVEAKKRDLLRWRIRDGETNEMELRERRVHR